MENITINFEVPQSPMYTADYLTKCAKRFVMELIHSQERSPSSEELDTLISQALLTRTAEEEHRELKSRWQQMSNNSTGTSYTSDEVFKYLETLS